MWARFLLIALSLTYSNGYKILVVFSIPAKSHSILGDGIVNALAKANHQVTHITPFPKNNPMQNVREIDTSEVVEFYAAFNTIRDIGVIMNKEKATGDMGKFMGVLTNVTSITIKNPYVEKLLSDPKEQFDVVIVEWLFYEVLAGLSAVFNCPYIWVSPTDPHSRILKLVDDVSHPSYMPDLKSSNYPPFTFIQRATELLTLLKSYAIEYFTSYPIQSKAYEEILVPIILKRGHKVPAYEDLIYNASLVLSNSHVSIGKAVSLPQNFIPIGGYHIIREVKPLPDNLKKLLDNSKNGLIYFSMGSNLKSKLMPVELKQSLLKMFGTLKHNVIWKFEEDLPGTPSNVHIVQWAPQQSILAHPNCILFVTHGGLLSTTETIHFGKPIVVIPVFGDQFNNANLAVRKGFAKKVDLSYTMADDLKVAIEGILADPTYAVKAKQLSVIYHDRPITPDKELVHWVEHVVKTGGAPHLRSPALALTWYQKLYLDLTALILLVLIGILYVFKRITSIFKTDTRVKEKEVKDKKKKQ